MLAHQGACRGKRIVFADELDGLGIASLANKRNVPRHVHVCRAQRFAGHALPHALGAATTANMSINLGCERFKRIKRRLSSLVAHRAVGGIADHGGKRAHGFHRFGGCLAVCQLAHHSGKFRQAIAAGNAFPASLVGARFQQGCLGGQGALPRRRCLDPTLKTLEVGL